MGNLMSALPSVTQQSSEGLLHARLWGEWTAGVLHLELILLCDKQTDGDVPSL